MRNALDQEFDAMGKVIDSLRDAVAEGITEQIAADFDTTFHDLIYQSAYHRRLYETWTSLKPQIYLFLLSCNIANSDFRNHTVQSHLTILNALRARDEKCAGRGH